MDRNYIASKATRLSSKEELLALLNEVKRNKLGDDAYPFAMRQLNYFCNPNHLRDRYITFEIPKKSGKALRQITAPKGGLKSLLVCVNSIFEAMYEAEDCVMGFASGRSVVTNATVHVGQNYLLNLDLKDFFTSIEQARVWKRLQLPPFCFKQEIANILAGLCCMKAVDEDKYVLPQGAPTSPIITNMICGTLDRRLKGLAKRFGLKYTRYADDITFSSMHNVYEKTGVFWNELERIIREQNFTINENKTRMQKRGGRQEVTGLIVSEKVNVPRKYTRELRSILYIWEKYGYDDAYSRFYSFYKINKGHIKIGEPILENVLRGKLQYLKMVKGAHDSTYLSLRRQFDNLCLVQFGHLHLKKNPELTYLVYYSLLEFETLFQTTIVFEQTEKGNYTCKCVIDSEEKSIAINRQVGLFFKKNISGSEDIKEVVSDLKKELFVALCQSENEPFWMILKENPENNVQKPDELSLDRLLEVWEEKDAEAAIDLFDNANQLKKQRLQFQGKTGMMRTDKTMFVSMLMKDSSLSEKNKEKIIELLAKELRKVEYRVEKNGEEESRSIHAPRKVVDFLSKFTRKDSVLKYTTHLWDLNPGDKQLEFDGYEDFVGKYKPEVENLYDYNPQLHFLIRNFLISDKETKDSKYWWGKYRLKVGYCFPKDVMRNWMNANPGKRPFAMPLSVLPEEYIPQERINDKTLVYFEDIVEIFKCAIEFRDNNLYYLVKNVFRNSDTQVDPDKLETLKGKCFYTDTFQVEQALQIIAGNIRMRSTSPSVEISAEEQIIGEDRFVVLNILHVDSYSDKSIDDDKLNLKNSKGQMKDIKDKLCSLCDFSVESRFREYESSKYFRIDYLYDRNANKFPRRIRIDEEHIDNCRGFKYILKFYL